MRILIIEDEKKTAEYLRKGLQEHGFIADISADGEDGLYLAQTGDYDLIILDIMLPKKDGWSIITEIRHAGKQTPVIFLTAIASIQNKVKGLKLGADDYLIKPFSFSELLARVRSILRRGPTRQPEMLTVADLQIDLLKHRATRQEKRIDLTSKEFVLLTLLVKRKGEVLSRTLIAEQVWDMNFNSDTNVVDVAIRRLRRKIDDPFSVKLIHTIHGVGYVLDE